VTVWFAFLRGINLGKRQIKMAELREALEGAGFTDVRTVVASGNVRLDGGGTEETVRKKLEATIEARFGFPVGVVLRSEAELKALAASHPFGKLDPEADFTRHVIFFAESLPDGLEAESRPGNTEILRIAGREIFIAAYRQPNGRYTEHVEEVLKPVYARLGKGVLDTMRNWNTIEKLVK
jgi:uncharacterized protein (DUF1697 family)